VLRTEIPDEIVSLLFLDLQDMLHQIQENYALSEPSQSTSQEDERSLVCLTHNLLKLFAARYAVAA
jgi:hypothetical protein